MDIGKNKVRFPNSNDGGPVHGRKMGWVLMAYRRGRTVNNKQIGVARVSLSSALYLCRRLTHPHAPILLLQHLLSPSHGCDFSLSCLFDWIGLG